MAFYVVAEAAGRVRGVARAQREPRASRRRVARAAARSSCAAAAPATPCAARAATGTLGPDLTHVGEPRLARRRHAAQRRRRARRLDRVEPARQAGQPDAVVRRASPARSCARSPPTSRACDDDRRRRVARFPIPLPRPPGELEAAASASGALPRGLARPHRRQQHLHRRLLRRRPRSCSSCSPGILALLMRTQLAVPENDLVGPDALQPALHDARHGDDVPVRRAGGRGDGRAAAAQHARRARPAVPAPVRVRVLGVLRSAGSCSSAASSSALAPDGGWFMYPPLTDASVLAGHQRGLLAARHRLHRDLGDRRRDRDHRRRAAHARARHDARPHADLRVGDAGVRA